MPLSQGNSSRRFSPALLFRSAGPDWQLGFPTESEFVNLCGFCQIAEVTEGKYNHGIDRCRTCPQLARVDVELGVQPRARPWRDQEKFLVESFPDNKLLEVLQGGFRVLAFGKV